MIATYSNNRTYSGPSITLNAWIGQGASPLLSSHDGPTGKEERTEIAGFMVELS